MPIRHTILLLLFFFVFDRYVPVSLSLSVVLVAAWFHEPPGLWWFAFGTGLLSGMLSAHRLGVSSIFLIAAAILIYLVREQFRLRSGVLVFFSGVLGETAWRLLIGGRLDWVMIAAQGILVWSLWLVIGLMGAREGVYLRK